MTENDPASGDPRPPEDDNDAFARCGDDEGGTVDFRTAMKNLRWFLVRAAAVLGASLLLMTLLGGFAAVYTSRPQFCRSCHIMEPYYVSWQESNHSNVSCIKCHFPPGFGEEVRGKMLGLVQLAKYVTASEGPRPAAEIPDASCLRSGCHETRLLSGRVEFHGVLFDHRPHLEEVRRGMKLRCTSCHSQIVQGRHMTVTTSTCFLCHFKEGRFNEGLGACTRCHQIPTENFELGGNVTFNHELAYDRGVDCANCHGDLIRGDGQVPQERCTVCHNRESDLARINDIAFLHQKHVAEHKVDCLLCHLEIRHSLDKNRIVDAADNCAGCHPQHHSEQVRMLEGIGGKSIPNHASSMAVARIACPSCHRVKQASPTGTVLWKASTAICAECHTPADVERFKGYHEALRDSRAEIEANHAAVRKALDSAKIDPGRKQAMTAELNDIQHDLNFLKAANDIHNIHYATTLTRALVDHLAAMGQELKINLPEIKLPQPAGGGE